MTKKALPLSVALFLAVSAIFAQTTPRPNKKALEAMSNGDFRGAISILDKDISNEKNLFDSYVLRSDLKKMTGDFGGALNDVNSAIDIRSDDGSLYERRADLRSILRQDSKEVLADLDKAITHGIKHARVYAQRGSIRLSTGDHSGAIEDLRTAIGMQPNNSRAYVALSGVYRRMEDDDNAIKVLEEFIAGIENSTSSPKPLEGRATVLTSTELPKERSSDPKTGQESVVIVSSVRVSSPASPDHMRAMGERMEQSKNTALAYVILADLNEKRSNLQRAMELVEKGIALDPTDYYAFEVRGRIKIGQKDFDGAVLDLDRSINGFPVNPRPYMDRGIANLMLGNEEAAKQDFDRYLELNPRGKDFLEKRVQAAKAAGQK